MTLNALVQGRTNGALGLMSRELADQKGAQAMMEACKNVSVTFVRR